MKQPTHIPNSTFRTSNTLFTRIVSLLVAEAFLFSSVLPAWALSTERSHLRPTDAKEGGIGKEITRELKTDAAQDGGLKDWFKKKPEHHEPIVEGKPIVRGGEPITPIEAIEAPAQGDDDVFMEEVEHEAPEILLGELSLILWPKQRAYLEFPEDLASRLLQFPEFKGGKITKANSRIEPFLEKLLGALKSEDPSRRETAEKILKALDPHLSPNLQTKVVKPMAERLGVWGRVMEIVTGRSFSRKAPAKPVALESPPAPEALPIPGTPVRPPSPLPQSPPLDVEHFVRQLLGESSPDPHELVRARELLKKGTVGAETASILAVRIREKLEETGFREVSPSRIRLTVEALHTHLKVMKEDFASGSNISAATSLEKAEKELEDLRKLDPTHSELAPAEADIASLKPAILAAAEKTKQALAQKEAEEKITPFERNVKHEHETERDVRVRKLAGEIEFQLKIFYETLKFDRSTTLIYLNAAREKGEELITLLKGPGGVLEGWILDAPVQTQGPVARALSKLGGALSGGPLRNVRRGLRLNEEDRERLLEARKFYEAALEMRVQYRHREQDEEDLSFVIEALKKPARRERVSFDPASLPFGTDSESMIAFETSMNDRILGKTRAKGSAPSTSWEVAFVERIVLNIRSELKTYHGETLETDEHWKRYSLISAMVSGDNLLEEIRSIGFEALDRLLQFDVLHALLNLAFTLSGDSQPKETYSPEKLQDLSNSLKYYNAIIELASEFPLQREDALKAREWIQRVLGSERAPDGGDHEKEIAQINELTQEGKTLLEQGDLQGAEEWFHEAAFGINRHLIETFYPRTLLARIYLSTGRTHQAGNLLETAFGQMVQWFKSFDSLDKKTQRYLEVQFPIVRNTLADAYRQNRREDRAIETAQIIPKFLSDFSSATSFWLRLRRMLERKGKYALDEYDTNQLRRVLDTFHRLQHWDPELVLEGRPIREWIHEVQERMRPKKRRGDAAPDGGERDSDERVVRENLELLQVELKAYDAVQNPIDKVRHLETADVVGDWLFNDLEVQILDRSLRAQVIDGFSDLAAALSGEPKEKFALWEGERLLQSLKYYDAILQFTRPGHPKREIAMKAREWIRSAFIESAQHQERGGRGIKKWTDEKILFTIKSLHAVGEDLSLGAVGKNYRGLLRGGERSYGRWKSAVEVAGLDYDTIRKNERWSNEKIVSTIKSLYEEGEDLSSGAIRRSHNDLYVSAKGKNRFKSWAAAIEASGLDYATIRKGPARPKKTLAGPSATVQTPREEEGEATEARDGGEGRGLRAYLQKGSQFRLGDLTIQVVGLEKEKITFHIQRGEEILVRDSMQTGTVWYSKWAGLVAEGEDGKTHTFAIWLSWVRGQDARVIIRTPKIVPLEWEKGKGRVAQDGGGKASSEASGGPQKMKEIQRLMEAPPEDYADRILKIREVFHLSQPQFGSLLNPPVSKQAVSDWEHGNFPISDERRKEIDALLVQMGSERIRKIEARDGGEKEQVDLNQQDLERLRVQLREAFQRDLLSDGAIKGILKWRTDHGQFTSLDELTQIRGIGTSIMSELRRKLKPLLHPLPDPVRIVFGYHRTAEDAKWDMDQLQEFLEDIEIQRPVVIWLEHAYFQGLPEDVKGIVEALGVTFNWREEILHEPVKPAARAALEKLFEKFRRQEEAPTIKEIVANKWASLEPFGEGELKGIKELVSQGWNIRLMREEGSFEAYLNSLRYDVIHDKAFELFLQGFPEEALKHLAAALRYYSEENFLRDDALTSRIVQYHQKYPEALHLVIRGSGLHVETMPDLLHRKGISQRHSINPESQSVNRLAKYRYILEGIPPVDTPQGRRLLAEEFFGGVVLTFLLNKLNLHPLSPFSQEVYEWVASIPDTLLESWLKAGPVLGIPTRNWSIVETKTWEWLKSHLEELSPETKTLYEKINKMFESAESRDGGLHQVALPEARREGTPKLSPALFSP